MGADEQGTQFTKEHWITVPRTLCFILHGDDVLLLKRAAHKRIFPNRYNGVGGHIERNEDPLTSLKREVLEETGLTIDCVELKAIYNVDAGTNTGVMVLVFTAHTAIRDVIDSDEGTLHWVHRDAIADLDLVDDLPLILPNILRMNPGNAPLYVHMSYDHNDAMLLTLGK